MSFDDGLVLEFVAEAKDHLSNIEPDLLRLEKEGNAVGQDIVNRIFRAIHSIKGAAGFFGFDRLKRLSHVMESVLMQIRDGAADPTPAVVEPLLKGVDRLNEMVQDIERSETVDCDAEVAWLERILNGGNTPDAAKAEPAAKPKANASAPAEAAPKAVAPVAVTATGPPLVLANGVAVVAFGQAEAIIDEALKFGQFFYRITLSADVDLTPQNRSLMDVLVTLNATGQLYTHSPYNTPFNLPEACPPGESIQLLYSTVLETDLVCCSIGIEEDAIQIIDIKQSADSTAEAQPGATVVPFNLTQLEEAKRFGHHFYHLTLDANADLAKHNRTLAALLEQLQTAGLLYTHSSYSGNALPTECNPEAPVSLLYSTVLEAGLLAVSFDLDEARIETIAYTTLTGDDSEEQAVQQLIAQQLQEKEALAKQSGQASEKPKAKKSMNAESSETVRVRVDLLNRMMDLAGEMVLSRNQLLSTLEGHHGGIPGLASILQNVDLVTSDLQEHIMQTRMQTIGTVFNKFPRVVRDIAKTLGKEIHLLMTGEDVELDKSIIENLSDPLTHLIRNCCDHGIETPIDRVKNSKQAFGTIQLKAYHEAGQINIAIIDDGRGIDPNRVLQKALMTGAISEADVKKMSHQDMVNLIFLPGLSTAEKISDISGRGVGMDVVRTNIEQIGGSIQIESNYGQGTTILLRLPLTLAIIPSLIVGVAGQKFAMPQINVLEMVRVHARDLNERIEQVGSASVLRLRGNLLPLLNLGNVLNMERTAMLDGNLISERRENIADVRQTQADEEENPINRRVSKASDVNIMVLKTGKFRYGLIVDELFDIEEIVVKPLANYLKNSRCFAGATIMGDGRVAMILDATGIMQHAKLSFSDLDALSDKIQQDVEENPNGVRQAVILFNISQQEIFAIPLSSVLRLEKIRMVDIERIGQREFLPYRGKGLPLIRLEDQLPIQPCGQPNEYAYLIVPKVLGGHSEQGLVGFVVTEIVDTLEVDVVLQDHMKEYPGIEGSALVNNHMTVFINAQDIIENAGINLGVTVAPASEAVQPVGL
jgi:two-component system, chemotaxis family, sensor kinase CheA